MYVLIVALWFTGYTRGYTVTTQEFSSEELCVAAGKASIEMVSDGPVGAKFRCVQK